MYPGGRELINHAARLQRQEHLGSEVVQRAIAAFHVDWRQRFTCLYGVFAEDVPEADEKTIIGQQPARAEWMLGTWQQRWNRPPTRAEFDGLVQQYIRETVLVPGSPDHGTKPA